jgi:hypothetical protein
MFWACRNFRGDGLSAAQPLSLFIASVSSSRVKPSTSTHRLLTLQAIFTEGFEPLKRGISGAERPFLRMTSSM